MHGGFGLDTDLMQAACLPLVHRGNENALRLAGSPTPLALQEAAYPVRALAPCAVRHACSPVHVLLQ